MSIAVDHNKDEDCTLDKDTDLCVECGVYHGDKCIECNGRGFHRDNCTRIG